MIHCVKNGSFKIACLGLKDFYGLHDVQTIKQAYLKILGSIDIGDSSVYISISDQAQTQCALLKTVREVLHAETRNTDCKERNCIEQLRSRRCVASPHSDHNNCLAAGICTVTKNVSCVFSDSFVSNHTFLFPEGDNYMMFSSSAIH